MEKAQNGLFLIFFLIKNEKLWVRNRSHTEFCGDPVYYAGWSFLYLQRQFHDITLEKSSD